MSSSSTRPKIGVGVIIHDNAGNIVMGERAGSHGAGTSILPLNLFFFPPFYAIPRLTR
jgi:hypothetical protein